MIREKIFRVHRHTRSSLSTLSAPSPSPSPSSHKFLFSFSSIQAVQVPKGWHKLVVSLISPESGKAVCKSGKVQVKNGSCQWTETLSQSIWIPDVNSSKDQDEHPHKFLVSTGSPRSGVLGDATINLAAFMSLESPVLLSLPLENCNSGTILQVEVTCLTPKIDFSSSVKGEDRDEPDHSTINFGSLSHPRELAVEDACFSPSISRYSFDSTDNANRREDSIESNDRGFCSTYSTHRKSVRSIQGPFAREMHDKNHRQGFGEPLHADVLSLQKNGSSSSSSSSSQCFTGDSTVQELEAEARMWERNARKLTVDLETTRKDMSDQNLTVTNLNIELSASRSDCQKLAQEIEHLKSEIQETGGSNNIRWELENEMRFLKEQNENLSMQLRKTQDSNIKLIFLLREMEEAAEKQNLAYLKSENDCRHEDSDEASVVEEVPASEEFETADNTSETNILEHFARENNCNLELELLNLRDSLQNSKDKISILESTLKDRIIVTEVEQDLTNHIIKWCLVECNHILNDKEEQIMNPEVALSEALHGGHFADGQAIELVNVSDPELETDGNEQSKSANDDEPAPDVRYLRNKMPDDDSTVLESNEDSMEEKKYTHASSVRQEIMERDCIISNCFSRSVSGTVLYSNSSSSISSHTTDNNVEEIRLRGTESINAQWAKHITELEEENVYLVERVSGLEAQLRYLVDEKESNRLELQHSEYQAMTLQDQVRRLEEEIQARKLESKQKLQGMEERWLETREECESLGKLNVKLQTTTETLAEECRLLQKLVGELKEQKLTDQYMFLKTEARKHPDDCSRCAEKITKTVIDEMESKLKNSELSKLLSDEENRALRMQLQRVPELQNEVLELRLSLKEIKSQAQLLKASLKSLSEENEELKHERVSMVQKISCLSKAVSEGEDRWHKKIALEEKILRLEGDLIARDRLCVQDAEMRHDLGQTKILNSQLAMKVKHLEELREHMQCKLQSYEGRLKQAQHAEEIHRNVTSESGLPDSHPLGNELDKGPEANSMSKLQDESTPGVVSRESDSKEVADTVKPKHTILEAELKDIQERYLQMSLKYAEVEAQREQLVMKLKALRGQVSFSPR